MTLRELHDAFLESNGVCIDSRNFKKGMVFIALKGHRHDGHDYINIVLRKSPKLVICEKYTGRSKQTITVVKNSLAILQKLATYHRKRLEAKVVAITGSNGKTTTRSLLTALLRTKYQVTESYSNYNNHIGVPLSLLRAKLNDEFVVIEMGANHIHEIKELCRIALPDFGLITNVGKAHIGRFGSFEDIKNAKAELYVYLANHQKLAFVDGKAPHLLEMATIVPDKVFYNQQVDHPLSTLLTRIENIQSDGLLSFDMISRTAKTHIQTNLVGTYNIQNIVASVTIAEHFSISTALCAKALEEFDPRENRSQMVHFGNSKIILDAYNANPTSVMAALNNFHLASAKSKCVILGGMKELGVYAPKEHKFVLDELKNMKLDRVICIGLEFIIFSTEYPYDFFNSTNDLSASMPKILDKHDLILIKGSRSYELEKLVDME